MGSSENDGGHKHGDRRFKNMHLLFTTFNEDIAKKIQNLITQITTSNHTIPSNETLVVFFGFGSWDIHWRSFSSFFNTVHLVINSLKELVQKTYEYNFRFIYMTHPSIWDDSLCWCHLYPDNMSPKTINSFSIAASNRFFLDGIKDIESNLSIFNFFDMTISRSNLVRDHVHYLGGPELTTDGSVGKMAVNTLLSTICPNI